MNTEVGQVPNGSRHVPDRPEASTWRMMRERGGGGGKRSENAVFVKAENELKRKHETTIQLTEELLREVITSVSKAGGQEARAEDVSLDFNDPDRIRLSGKVKIKAGPVWLPAAKPEIYLETRGFDKVSWITGSLHIENTMKGILNSLQREVPEEISQKPEELLMPFLRNNIPDADITELTLRREGRKLLLGLKSKEEEPKTKFEVPFRQPSGKNATEEETDSAVDKWANRIKQWTIEDRKIYHGRTDNNGQNPSLREAVFWNGKATRILEDSFGSTDYIDIIAVPWNREFVDQTKLAGVETKTTTALCIDLTGRENDGGGRIGKFTSVLAVDTGKVKEFFVDVERDPDLIRRLLLKLKGEETFNAIDIDWRQNIRITANEKIGGEIRETKIIERDNQDKRVPAVLNRAPDRQEEEEKKPEIEKVERRLTTYEYNAVFNGEEETIKRLAKEGPWNEKVLKLMAELKTKPAVIQQIMDEVPPEELWKLAPDRDEDLQRKWEWECRLLTFPKITTG